MELWGAYERWKIDSTNDSLILTFSWTKSRFRTISKSLHFLLFFFCFFHTDSFVSNRRISVLTDAKVEFGLIPKEHWFPPSWIDEDRATAERNKMADDHVIYGGWFLFCPLFSQFQSNLTTKTWRESFVRTRAKSYIDLFNIPSFDIAIVTCAASTLEWVSGANGTSFPLTYVFQFFFKHPLLQKYRYYWRIEYVIHPIGPLSMIFTLVSGRPDVHFHCDVNYDPFLFMQEQNKIYGKDSILHHLLFFFWHIIYRLYDHIVRIWKDHQDFVEDCKRLVFALPFWRIHFTHAPLQISQSCTQNTSHQITLWDSCHPTTVRRIICVTVSFFVSSSFFVISFHDDMLFCIVWSNFEIADMDFWRGKIYTDFFEYLDSTGGFYYEVHTIFTSVYGPHPSLTHSTSALGWCSRAQHRGRALHPKRPNSFLRRHRLRT